MPTKTKVIDKLRIQGNAAPRHGLEIRRPFHHPAFQDAQTASQFVFQADTRSIANGSDVTTIINSHPSSAASRKKDHLQRVQEANRGLTSAEYGRISREGHTNVHFLLRGKPAQSEVEVEMIPIDVVKHQRVGHYKTSAKEVYRARHKVHNDQMLRGDQGNFFRAIRTPFHDVETSGANMSPANHFYLGPSTSGQTNYRSLQGKRGDSEFTSSAPPILKRASHMDSLSSSYNINTGNTGNKDFGNELTLTGQPLGTPCGSPLEDDWLDNSDYQFSLNAPQYFNGITSMPDINSTPMFNRRKTTWSRGSVREPTQFKTDPNSLKQCLNIYQSHKIPPKPDLSPRDIVRLKHCPQAKVNYNNPYRNLRSKERKDLTNVGRYNFNSVESYIHFNKIYPRASELQVQSSSSHYGQSMKGLPLIPRVNGFTSHCTDTLLLKMMFEMNKPKSAKSVSKYSDVAVHKDLDEFMIVSTPTVSRSPSVISKKATPVKKARSQVSFVSKHKEEEETENVNEQSNKEESLNVQREIKDGGEKLYPEDLNDESEMKDENKQHGQIVLEESLHSENGDKNADDTIVNANNENEAPSNDDIANAVDKAEDKTVEDSDGVGKAVKNDVDDLVT